MTGLMALGRGAALPILMLGALLALSGPGDAWAATASGARLGVHGEGVTRFVVDLSESISFKTATQADPYRVVIETPGVDWSGNTLSKPWGAVNGLRTEDGRLILDLRKPALVKGAFIIAPRDGMGWRLVVDLAETTREGFLASVNGGAPVLKPPAAAKPVVLKPPPGVKPAPPVVEASPAEAPRPTITSIVVTSPNAALPPAEAPVTVAVQPPQPLPLPPPVADPVAASPLVSRGSVQVGGPAQVGGPVPVERPARGSAMLSVPMPPPPERPAPPVAAPVQLVPPPAEPAPVVQAVSPPQPLPAAAVKGDAPAKARDGVPVIVIDPGHGGVDPGATGVSGIYEKHITLAMARELKVALEKNGRYRVYLTRDRDVFIRLRDRVAIARQYGADLFVSLHADAVQNPQIRGLSVYTLSQNASDSEAQALAEKENKADLIAGVDLSHETPDVAGILIDLAQRETMNRSAGFASELVDEVGQEMDLLGNTHRFAGFAVLKAPDVPAVLVEMGYLSNEFEEKQLRQPQYRARLAKALAKAVERYFPSSLKAKRP